MKRDLAVLLGSLACAAALLPFDGAVSRVISSLGSSLGGDLRRELETLQQYGALGSVVLIGIVIWLLDPEKREHLADWAWAMLATAAVVVPMKILVGRPRPKFEDPLVFLGPLGRYRIDDEVGVRHSWEVFAGISSDLWSMPSSHTAYAVVLSVFLMTLYPKLRPLVLAMIGVVGFARVLFGSHYPSDVLVGGGIAWVTSNWAMRSRIGSSTLHRWMDQRAAARDSGGRS